MTNTIRNHFSIAVALVALMWGVFPAMGQGKPVGPHLRSGTVRSSTFQQHISGALSVGNFGTMDFPGASDSAAYYVNDRGQFAGGYGPDLEVLMADSGFVMAKDSFKSINFPGATLNFAAAINNSGEVVGTYIDAAGNWHGYKLVKGIYTSFDVPGAYLTQVDGISNGGEIIGLYYNTGDPVGHGFSLIGSTYTTIDVPGAAFTFPNTANKAGEIVGEYIDTAGDYHGFSWVSGVFTTIDYPGAVFSAIFGINDKGDMVGAYGDGLPGVGEGFEHGFLLSGGTFVNIDAPFVGVGATWASGINNSGQIAGLYADTAGRTYGYTAAMTSEK